MQRWLGQQQADDLAISDWVATEFSSALSIKLRTGQIEASHRADALATFTRLATDSFTVVPVSRLQFRTASRFADQHTLGLRAGDALHLGRPRRPARDALHTRPAAGPCRFGARRKDDPALTHAPLRAARSTADAANQPVTRSRFKIWYLGAFGSFSAMPPLCLPGEGRDPVLPWAPAPCSLPGAGFGDVTGFLT